LNPKVSPKDYLLMFKDFLRKWAYHMHTGNEIRDWYEAKDSYSSLIRIRKIDNKPSYSGCGGGGGHFPNPFN